MKRREFIRLMSGALAGVIAAPLSARAQRDRSRRPAHIGIVDNTPAWEPFRQRLRELGHVEGQDIVFDYRQADSVPDKLEAAAAALAKQPVDVIVVFGTPAALAAKRATTTVPIVAVSIGDPIGSGLVASFARPGGNITGNTILGPDVVTKRLQIIKDALPAAVRIALLWNPANASNAGILQQLRQAVPLFHMTLVSLPARTVDDFKQVYAQLAADPPDALLATNDPLHHDHMIEVIDFLLKHRIPGMFQIRQNVVDGGLMSYGANFADLFRQGALYVDKILHGSKPQDLPFEQPTKFDLTVNLKTAKALGITFSANFLALADEVIQ